MQRPTCVNVRIRSTRDAHIIFHAVHLNILPIITRRLDADERAALRSGCVYAWEERGPHTEVTGLGIERFTEGRRWGPSRVRDEFLFYYEKSPPGHIREKENPLLEERLRKHWDPLVKQTYSVWVESPRGRRKWHLTAYFTQATVDELQTVDDLPQLANLEVPRGKYLSTRLGKPRRPDDVNGNGAQSSSSQMNDVFRPANLSASRQYAPFPLPYEVTPPHHHPGQGPVDVHHPGPISHYAGYDYAHHHPQAGRDGYPGDASRHYYGATPAHHPRYPDNQLTLPPIHALAPVPGAPPPHERHYHEYYPHYQEMAHPHHPHHYASYPPPVPPDQYRSVYMPPTPTSSQYSTSPVYPTPTSSSASSSSPLEHPNGGQSSNPFTLREAYPSPYPSPPGKYPGAPATHAYQDPHSPPYINPPNHAHDRPLAVQPSPAVVRSQTSSSSSSIPLDPRLVGEGHSASPDSQGPPLKLPSPPRARSSVSDGCDEYGEDSSAYSPTHSPRSATSSSSAAGGKRLDLAPLRTLVRAQAHPYRRDKFDDKALMAFSGRKNSD